MAEETNVYASAAEKLHEYEEDLKEAFKKRANKSQKISTEGITDLIDDVSVILAVDCEYSKRFFSQENRMIPDDYNLNALDFNQFIELLRLWLQKESKRPPESFRSPTPGDISFITVSSVNQMLKNGPAKPLSNYEKNRRLLIDLLRHHSEDYKAIFKSRLMEEGQTEISIMDCFTFFQEIFYLDLVDLKEKASDTEDFFRSVNSYKRLFKLLEKYFMEEKKAGRTGANINELTVSFDDCFEFLDYWFRTNKDVVLVDNRKVKSEMGVKQALLETIETYEKMTENTSDLTEKEVLQTTVMTLRNKLQQLEITKNRRSKSLKEGREIANKEERKSRALKDIFEFYCTQQLNAGKSATFDKLNRLANTINLGTFTIFLKNFKLKINHLRLIELYKKSAGVDENLNFIEFQVGIRYCTWSNLIKDLLNKVALRVEIITEEKVYQPNPEVRKEYKPDSYKRDPFYKLFKRNDVKKRERVDVIKKIKIAFQIDDKKRDEERLEEIWEHMGLYDGTYRKFMGLAQLPITSQDKENFRIPTDSVNYKFKTKALNRKTLEDIQEEVDKRNHIRSFIKELRTTEKKMIQNSKVAFVPVNASVSQSQMQNNNYTERKVAKEKMNLPQIKKLSMKGVRKLQEGEIIKLNDSFDPHDLIDENDDEDDLYLAEYQIQDYRLAKVDQSLQDKRKFEEYGRLRKPRGFAVNGRYGSVDPSRVESKHSFSEIEPAAKSHINYAYSDSRIYQINQASPRSNSVLRPAYLGNEISMLYNPNSLRNSPVIDMQEPNVGRSVEVYRTMPFEYNPPREPIRVPYVANNGYYVPKIPNYKRSVEKAKQAEVETKKKHIQCDKHSKWQAQERIGHIKMEEKDQDKQDAGLVQIHVAQKGPYKVELKAGETYNWCACGRSKTQPFCDGSHKKTPFKPVTIKPTEDQTVYLCGCKKSKNQPYCDGAHLKLDF